MKRLFLFLVVLLLCGIGVGFARGWFAVSHMPDSGNNKVDIKVTVDPDKVKADTKKATEEVKDLPNKFKGGPEKPGERDAKSPPGTP